MFSVIVKCFSRITKKDSREVKLLMLGLDNAGKSTIINDLKGEPKELTMPTIGFASADFKLLNFKVTAYDVGGGPRIRGIWKDYYAEVFGAVFVVDASDHDRIAESRTVLREALSDSRLGGKPFVVFANKQDLDGALSEQDIELQFELEQLAKKCGSHYKVFQCTALLNGGRKIDSQLKKGFNWLLETLNEDFPSLKERVQREVEVQKEVEKKKRAERLERVRRRREERERAEREKEATKQDEEEVDSDDEDVVFGNALPRVIDVSKTKKKTTTEERTDGRENPDDTVEHLSSCSKDNEPDANVKSQEPESLQRPSESTAKPETKKKRKKKKKTRRNQTAPSDDGENSDAGIVLKPIAWKTPPASLNGFPVNGRRLEPIRPPLHNNLYSPSNTGVFTDDETQAKFNNGHIRTHKPRPNEEDGDVVT